ncbi:hypothetical protein Pcaca05_08730 [Pectobacterium carotovorum subsp. carotovorum]|nr:hypothetical protein Pcaca05_08730 [Pectobacterium carotovorum subsp. carotovorum]
MTPAGIAIFIIKDGDSMRRLTVLYELMQRMLACRDTRRTLYRMNATYQIERVDNQQMDGHRVIPDVIRGGSQASPRWYDR